MNLNNITLISVACIRVPETFRALQYSMRGINFGSVKLLTNAEVSETRTAGVDIVKIPTLDYEGYNKFIVYELSKHIDTDYAIIAQDDGYIINPESWRDEFFEYDYIGAPFPLPKDDFSFRDRKGNIFRTGNGGFSLRSKGILELATKLNLPWEPFHGYYNEDGFFCANNRHIYEENGFKFAPVEVAKHFSHESDIDENKDIVKPFGFHGKWSKFKVI